MKPPPLRLTDKTPKEYAVYRSPLLLWGLVDLVYDMFRVSILFDYDRAELSPDKRDALLNFRVLKKKKRGSF